MPLDTAASGIAPSPKLTPRQRKALVAGAVGNTVEWVDWALYGIFVKIIADVFFPKADGTVALLSTLAVFAVGFVMRPVGAAFLGAYADRHGRKKGLALTIGLMAGAGFVIALTPGYGTIGIAAPWSSCCRGWPRASPQGASSARPRRSWWSPPRPADVPSPGPGSRYPWRAAS